MSFHKIYKKLLNLNKKAESNLFNLSRKINGILNLDIDNINSSSDLVDSIESEVEFMNGNIFFHKLLLNFKKMGASDINGILRKDGKIINYDFKKSYDLINEIKIDPKNIGIKFNNPDNLKGRDPDYNATKIIDIFSGIKNEFSEAVCLNSAAALIVCNKFNNFKDAYEFAKKHLESGNALTHLKKIQTF